MDREQRRLKTRAYQALLGGARTASSGVAYDQKGYASCWQDNVSNELPLADIIRDLANGAGHELNGKLSAAHSSAALVLNTFGPWRTDPASLWVGDLSGFRTLRFEATCPTGLGRIPPHLDVLADGDAIVAIESKCTEWMDHRVPFFANSYDRLRKSHGSSPWFEQMHQLRADPNRYRYLDAAQLVKHAFGLMNEYRTDDVRLVYLYWEPRNAGDWRECRQHRAEAHDLVDRVRNSKVRLIPMSYRELWESWERAEPPSHLSYLKTRYDQDV